MKQNKSQKNKLLIVEVAHENMAWVGEETLCNTLLQY